MDKMDRLTAIRMAGIGGAAVLVGGKYLGEPSEAIAMNSRFDAVLSLHDGRVMAAGPTNFAADERRARVFAQVAQGARVQASSTDWVSGQRWSAGLFGPLLKPGAADAYGVAYVENQDGSFEWYPWEVAVTLR